MFWDNVAWIYDLFANLYNKKVNKELCRVVAEYINEGDNVLECACGTGLLSLHIASKCGHLTATDFSENMLKIAGKKCSSFRNTIFEKADILNLGYPDNSFDKVVAGNVIHLLNEPVSALKELVRVCKSGGRIIIPTYVVKEGKGRATGFVKAVGKAGADFKQSFTFSSYRDLFKEAGYELSGMTMIAGRVPCAVAVITKA